MEMQTAYKTPKKIAVLALTFVTFYGCKPAGPRGASGADLSTSPAPVVESVLSSVNSIAQDVTAEPYAISSPGGASKLDAIFMTSDALAAACVRTRTLYQPGQACTSSSLSQNLGGCTIANGDTLTGTITLTCEDSAGTSPLCSCYTLANQLGTGLSITRTGDVTRTLVRSGLGITLSSAAHFDYRGDSYGGGVKLTRSDLGSSYSVQIKGIRRSVSSGGSIISDLSIKTTSNIEIGSTLGRSGRTISGGSVQIANNLDRSLTTLTLKTVQTAGGASGCCHPIGGSATLTSGARTLTVSFSGPPSAACGTISVAETGKSTYQKLLSACE